jgi:hypothetical protein
MNYLIDYHTFIEDNYEELSKMRDELLSVVDDESTQKGSIIHHLLMIKDNLEVWGDLQQYKEMMGFN